VKSEYEQNFQTISEEVLVLVRSMLLFDCYMNNILLSRYRVKFSLEVRMLLEQFLDITAYLGYLAQGQLFLIFIPHPCDVSLVVNNYFTRSFQVMYDDVYLQRG